MKILITGSQGFVGSRLVKLFLQNGHHIVAGYNQFHCLQSYSALYELFRINCTEKIELENAISVFRPDFVIHCAAKTNPQVISSNIYETNVLSSELLAEFSKIYNFKLVFISTDLIYQKSLEYSNEETTITQPIENEYANSKYLAEEIIVNTSNNWLIIRPTLMYGISNKFSNSFNNFIEQTILKNENVFVFSDQSRCFLFVDDLCNAIELLLSKNITNEIFVIGGGESLTRSDFAFRYSSFFNLDTSLIKPILTSELKNYTGIK
ncbi:MAG: NAD-dependent epimerase/dehydratase family protein, partial [Candidatus Kapaibacterium sp.]